MKKFWDQYYQPGIPYDAVARRAGAAGSASAASRNAAPAPRVASESNRSSSAPNPVIQARVRTTQSGSPASARNGVTTSHLSAGYQTGGPAAEIKRLKQELAEREAEVEQLTADVEGAEKESRFYFEKLRCVFIFTMRKSTKAEKVFNHLELWNKSFKRNYRCRTMQDPLSSLWTKCHSQRGIHWRGFRQHSTRPKMALK